MMMRSIVLIAAVITLGLVFAQDDICSKARDCKKVAFVYAFTEDTDPERVDAAEADKIKAEVRKCFMPCAESARKIAKLQIAAGDPLFDTKVSKVETSGRGRGRISTPENPWGKASRAQVAQANGKVSLALRRTQSSPSRVARQVSDDGSCVSRILGKSAFDYLKECEASGASVSASASVSVSASASVTTAPNAKPTTTSFLSSIRSQFNRAGGRGKRQSGKFNANADANGELLYSFAYSKEIATRMCPDKKAEILKCVNTATKGRVNLDKINANTVKSRYCKVEADCEKKKTDCIASIAQEQQENCKCNNQMKVKLAGRCTLPPSPCDVQMQSVKSTRDESGDVCNAAVPTSAEIIAQLRKKHGAGDYEVQADARKNKQNNGNRGNNGNNGNRNTTKRPVATTRRPSATTKLNPLDRLNNLFNRGRAGK